MIVDPLRGINPYYHSFLQYLNRYAVVQQDLTLSLFNSNLR